MNWKTCPTHGPDKPSAWGCPECVREQREELTALRAEVAALREDAERLRSALEFIASPMRPDGTWNRDRAACQQLAALALTPNVGAKRAP
jgi:hypothetical protein